MSGDGGQSGEIARLRRMIEDQNFAIETLGRQLDEVLLTQRLAAVADVDRALFLPSALCHFLRDGIRWREHMQIVNRTNNEFTFTNGS